MVVVQVADEVGVDEIDAALAILAIPKLDHHHVNRAQIRVLRERVLNLLLNPFFIRLRSTCISLAITLSRRAALVATVATRSILADSGRLSTLLELLLQESCCGTFARRSRRRLFVLVRGGHSRFSFAYSSA